MTLRHASFYLGDNMDFVKNLMGLNVDALKYTSKMLANDKDIVMEVIKRRGTPSNTRQKSSKMTEISLKKL